MNKNRIITGAAAVVAAAGLAFGAASLANADDNSTSTPSPSSTGKSQDGSQQHSTKGNTDPSKPMRSDEQLLTGETLAKVTAAVKAKEPGATIERVETDSEGVYEAHMVRADGTRITVQVDKNFAVTNVQEGGPNGSGGPGGPGGRGDHEGATDDGSQPAPSSTDSTDSTEAN